MATMIFVNLPVENLAKATAFYTALAFTPNARFSDDNASAFVISDTIHLMLLTKPFFKGFTNKEVADASTTTEVITCLSADTRAGVDDLADKALAAGGTPSKDPMDGDSMYSRSFQDLDGHLWEVMYMDMSAVPAQA